MAKRRDLLPKDGSFYKANLHSHTTLSDGSWTPEESKRHYKEHGYSILALTDHNYYANHADLTDPGFLMLAALEVNIDDWARFEGDWNCMQVYHLNFYDKCPPEGRVHEDSFLPERRYSDINYINEFIASMADKGFIACYNHPYWSLQNYDDFKNLRGLFAMEIYNHGCEHDGLYGYMPQAYDEMLRTGCRLHCLATDDNHDRFPIDDPLNDSFGGFTMIKATELSYEAVIDALIKGNFYSSMGPEIHELYLEDNRITVKCSPVEKIYVCTEGRDTYHRVAKPGETITEATFELSGHEGYIRIDCRDGRGLHANSNAYYLNDLSQL